MRQEPPKQLLELVQRTGLATTGQVRGVLGRAKRLARGLPLLESVWVDALAQGRIITRFQATRLNAGEGDLLRVGPYLILRRLPSAGYVDCYQAREVESGRPFWLAVVEDFRNRADDLLGRLERLVRQSSRLACENLSPLVGAGEHEGRIWAAAEHQAGPSAAEWMVRNGRFRPDAVVEIARRMLPGLIELEQAGLPHGDICSLGLTLTDNGRVVLSPPGLRGVVRPEEGYGLADLAPEYYDYLAPERVDAGTGPTIQSDVYSAGCLWWHLLAGRPPVPGGNSLAKLRGHQTVRIPDVCQMAPDTSPRLADAIAACCQRAPGSRPDSMRQVSEILGAATAPGKTGLARCLSRGGSTATHAGVSIMTVRRSSRAVWPLAVTVGSVIGIVALLWSSWPGQGPVTATGSPTRRPPASEQQIQTPRKLKTGNQPPAALPTAGSADRPPMAELPHGGSAAVSRDVVLPARYDAVLPRDRADSHRTGPDDLILPTEDPIRAESLQLVAGQHVRGADGGRPLVEVPYRGLVVRPEDICFENVDFVWESNSQPSREVERPAMVLLEASRVQFHGCSFRPAQSESRPTAAIRWTHPLERNELDLPQGQIVIGDCVFDGVEAAVACQTVGAVSLEFSNVLHLRAGPLVWLDHAPVQDEPVGLGMTNVTLRESGPVMECTFTEIASRPGNISIRANGSAFVPRPGSPLLSFWGRESPDRLLSTLYWSGQGSLISPLAVVAVWRRENGQTEVLDDATVSMAGLVRSKVGFAGPPEDGPAASQITQWQVPLRTSDPPGIDPRSLIGHDR